MTRIARVVAAGVPHHITQRGNRRQRTFFDDEDYEMYLRLMAASCGSSGGEFRGSSGDIELNSP